MLLKVGTQVSNSPKIALTKFHQHLSTGSQVFEGWHDNKQQRLTTRSRLCYRPHREIARCGQKKQWSVMTSVKNHLRGHTELFSSFFLLHKSNVNGGIWQKRKPAPRVKKEKTLQKGSECNSVKMIVKFTAFIRGANRTKYGIWWGNGGSEKNNCLN